MSATQQTVPRDSAAWPRGPLATRSNIFVTVGILVALMLLAGLFYKQNFAWLAGRDSMDTAQVARNVYETKKYGTRFLRPFNVALVRWDDRTMPELNRAPFFPCAAAGVFALKHAWSDQGAIWVSLAFLCLTVIATYVLGNMLFGWRAGLLAAAVVGTRAPALEVGISGQEWTMATFWFVLLLTVLAKHHKAAQREAGIRPFVWLVAAALLVACLFMTNHVLFFMVLPVALYFAFTGPARRLHLAVFLVCAALAVGPWAYRNVHLSGGSVLGASAWDLMRDTRAFPGDTFARSTDGAARGVMGVLLFPMERFSSFAEKLLNGSSDIIGEIVSMLGLVATAFAVVSMLYRFKVASANALRGFLYVAIPVLVAVFALFSANAQCVVLFLPIAAVFGSAYFLLLLDAKNLHVIYCRALIGGLVLVTAWPALGAIVFPRRQTTPNVSAASSSFFARRASGRGVVYVDVPWVVALRTDATAVWLPRTDKDADELDARGLSMDAVWLTPESDNYSRDEVWYLMHRWTLWRDYVRNPDACLKPIAAAAYKRAAANLVFAKDDTEVEKKKKMDDLRTRVQTNLRRTMDTRKRSCVLFRSVIGLEQEITGTKDEVPWPDPSDPAGRPNDANAYPEDIMLFIRLR